ncbi:putative RNA-binding protein isoform B, partial [Neolecta irregularis DAH-3]
MGMQRVRFAYSRDMKEVDDGWTCSNCAVVNYPRRPACFKCGTTKADAGLTQRTDMVNDGLRDISSEPSQFILLRNMDVLVTEQLVANAMKKLGVEIKRVLLIRDRGTGQSLGFGFVEYGDVNDAKQAMDKYGESNRFTIKSKAVHLTFCHGGVFVPVYAGDERVFVGAGGLQLAYWDDKAYASELVVNEMAAPEENAIEDPVPNPVPNPSEDPTLNPTLNPTLIPNPIPGETNANPGKGPPRPSLAARKVFTRCTAAHTDGAAPAEMDAQAAGAGVGQDRERGQSRRRVRRPRARRVSAVPAP